MWRKSSSKGTDMKQDNILKGDEAEKVNIEFGILEGVEKGLLEEIIRDNGEKAFRMTPKGAAYVERMPFESEEESEKWLKDYHIT